jgi:uncharacterized protein (DUF2252 family)
VIAASDEPRHDLRATVAERRTAGRLARQRAPRRELGAWDPDDRRQDALETVLAQNAIRDPALVPVRHGRMAASPWTYYRGAAAVMAADLASRADSGLDVQLCGDAHVLNFGLWATPERNLLYDLRDFDETLRGPFEWDVKRLATSLVVAARQGGVPRATAEEAVRATADAYRVRMAELAGSHELEVWYDATTVEDLLNRFAAADRGRVSTHIEKMARKRTSRGAFAKLTSEVGGRPRIDQDPPIRLAVPDGVQDRFESECLGGYRRSLQEDRQQLFDRFTVVDVVQQVVGVGSVGMRVYLVLLEGRLGDDPLFLQVKQAGPSVYESARRPSRHAHHGQRVVAGKRTLQTATDLFVGWSSFEGRDYYVRQFRDMKIVPNLDQLTPRLVQFAAASGTTLARAHARTGDAVAISAYIGKGRRFATAINEHARRYADQNERDHRQLTDAIRCGRVEADHA